MVEELEGGIGRAFRRFMEDSCRCLRCIVVWTGFGDTRNPYVCVCLRDCVVCVRLSEVEECAMGTRALFEKNPKFHGKM